MRCLTFPADSGTICVATKEDAQRKVGEGVVNQSRTYPGAAGVFHSIAAKPLVRADAQPGHQPELSARSALNVTRPPFH